MMVTTIVVDFIAMSSWFDTLTSAPVLVAGLVGISAALFVRGKDTHQVQEQAKDVAHSIQADSSTAKMAQTVSDDQVDALEASTTDNRLVRLGYVGTSSSACTPKGEYAQMRSSYTS